jgi:4-carboxymuconolactone decarboxylase
MTDSNDVSTDDEERRARGLAMMKQVYGWDITTVDGDFMELTVDHLFGEIWARDAFTVAERRLLLIGLLMGAGLDDVLGIQLDAATRLGELDSDQLRDLVIFFSHYAGWPRGAKLNSAVEELIAKKKRAE